MNIIGSLGVALALPKRKKRAGGLTKKTKKTIGIIGGVAAGAAALGGAAYGYNKIGQFGNLSPVQQMHKISSVFHKFDVKPGGFLHGIMSKVRGN